MGKLFPNIDRVKLVVGVQITYRELVRILLKIMLLAMVQLLEASCIGDGVEGICGYNVRIVYRYDMEGLAESNVLDYYVQSIDELIFDSNGSLVKQRKLSQGKLVSELELEPGEYRIVAWGNRNGDALSLATYASGKDELSDSHLYPDNPYPDTSGTQASGNRIYYGYRSFRVEKGNTSRLYVDMEHAHNRTRFTLEFQEGAERTLLRSRAAAGYYMQLEGMSSRTGFYPEYRIEGTKAGSYDRRDDRYPLLDLGHDNYLPYVNGLGAPVTYRSAATPDGNKLKAVFTAYRLRDENHPILSVWEREGNPDGTDRRILPLAEDRKIDLSVYFANNGIRLSTYRKQEFDIMMRINGENVEVWDAKGLDWEDGGTMGGW